ncbi:MAG: nitrogenase iron-molybdenum cofactor biosynthesis protein NifN [Chromatiales bacterium]|jgi:nitrogenase molybdenum-iron protein NifN|nr:nitrogenase iron-molybdenum cofactor biosynthesis protein NifN [Chromatiales bacterium]MDX9767861.1 nitrogenase iron-molybdenum cofactor biosynthesis protein NifN [Ectothiorhodospiraceae bacterium]
MAEIIKRNKALSVSPLKASQTLGGSLAVLGFRGAIPMMHGSQGCTAFGKVYFVRHFREPIPLQTTAMDQTSTVMGADDNVIEGLRVISEKSTPSMIGVLTTGLAETQGTDVQRAIKEFRAAHPQYDAVRVVGVNTPDFSGCFESGHAETVTAILAALVPDAASAGTKPGHAARRVNVLVGPMHTPGDVEVLSETIEAFGLEPVLIPDVSGSLDGHLEAAEFSPLSTGGTDVDALATVGDAAATLVIGASMAKAADVLKSRTGVPDFRFDHLYGLRACDAFVATLQQISGNPVPTRIERQRAQLQDALLDTHFMIGQARVAIAADPDQLHAFTQLLSDCGAEVTAAVVPARAPVLERTPVEQVKIGDLDDMEKCARERGVDLVIGNSHAAASAERLGVPVLRAGFPLYDRVGAYQRVWIGYRGSRQALFDVANLLLEQHAQHEIQPYRSIYAQKPEYRREETVDGSETTHATGGRPH